MEIDVSLIIVLYKPTAKDCQQVSHLADMYSGCIADNSPEPVFQGAMVGKMNYVWMQDNKGIAAAQNRAFEHISKDAPYVVFLDQDSRVGDDYPQLMAEALHGMENKGVGILGPMLVNADSGELYAQRLSDNADESAAYTRELISSGVCIKSTLFREIGMNDERLFIDYVDFDMCWRAAALGYRSAVSTKMKISHKVGRRCITIGPYRDIVSSPPRYYYQYRNMLWLLRRSYVPRTWKVKTTVKSTIRLVYLPFIGIRAFGFAMRGIIGGILTH